MVRETDFRMLMAGSGPRSRMARSITNVAIENGAHRIGDRLVVVAAVDQHKLKQPGNRPPVRFPGPARSKSRGSP